MLGSWTLNSRDPLPENNLKVDEAIFFYLLLVNLYTFQDLEKKQVGGEKALRGAV